MAVKITVGADLTPAQKEVDKFQDATAKAAKQSGEALISSFEKGASRAVDSLEKIEKAAEDTKGQTEKLFQLEQLESIVGKFGDVKDIIEKTGASVFGLDEGFIKTTSSVADLSQKGASLGSIFGPLGTAIGAAAGAAVGYFSAVNEEAAATEAAIKEVEAAATETAAEFETLSEADLSGLISQVVALQNQLDKAKGFSESTQKQIDALATKGAEGLSKAFDKLAGAALGDEFSLQGKSLEDLLTLYEDAQANLKDYSATAKAAATVTKEYASSQDVSANFVDKNKQQLDDLSEKIKIATIESAAYKKAIDAFATSTSTATTGLSNKTKATKELKEQVEELNQVIQEQIVIFVASAEASQKGSLVNLSAIVDETQTKIVASIKKTREELDTLFGATLTPGQLKAQTDAELKAIDESREAFFRDNPITVPLVIVPSDDFNTPLKELQSQVNSAIDDLSGAASAFLSDALSSSVLQVAENVEKGRKAYEGLGAAVGRAAQEQILALGKTWAFKAGGEAAEALASLAFGNVPGAILHGQAALLFGSLAAAAGVGAGLVGRALPSEATSATAAPAATGGSTSPVGGASFGGVSTFQELSPVQFQLAPGGTVVFAGDNRGRAQFGRFTDESVKSGRQSSPNLKKV